MNYLFVNCLDDKKNEKSITKWWKIENLKH